MGKKKTTRAATSNTPVKLLSGGNPQIAKGDGDGPVQQYLEALPGWKQAIGKRIDAIIGRAVPDVRKAVRWNTPFYGLEGAGWFAAFHCFNKYIKVSFFRGQQLQPVPPVSSKQDQVRSVHFSEDGDFDEQQFETWVQQAAKLPGERIF